MMLTEYLLGCPLCGGEHSVFANPLGIEQWLNGALIQNALPELTATEREQLISQLCPRCQASIFGDED